MFGLRGEAMAVVGMVICGQAGRKHPRKLIRIHLLLFSELLPIRALTCLVWEMAGFETFFGTSASAPAAAAIATIIRAACFPKVGASGLELACVVATSLADAADVRWPPESFDAYGSASLWCFVAPYARFRLWGMTR